MNQTEFVQALFQRARETGLRDFEVYLASGSSFEAKVFQGEIVSYSAADWAGLTLRLLLDGKMGYASTQAFDEESIELLIDQARENAALIEVADEQFLFSGSPEYASVCNYNPQIDRVSAAEKIDMARQLERYALEADPRVRQVGECLVLSQSSEIAIVNTRGLDLSHRVNWIGGYIEPVASEGEAVNTGSKLFFTNDPQAIDLKACAQEAVREATGGLAAKSVPSGEYRVLLSNLAMADLLSTFSGVFSAENAQKGRSLLAGREGERIAHPSVTIVDDPHMPAQAASTPFDAEGVASFPKKIVDQGVLITLLHNLKTARKAGVQSTGNASKSGYASPVGVAPSNFRIEPGALSLSGMLEALDDGLYITDLQGHHSGADAVSGDFSLSAKGHRVRKGQIMEAVGQITVSGNFFQALKDIEQAGSDLAPSFPGSSTFLSPSVLVRGLFVAGL